LQSVGRRRNILWARSSVAPDQQQTAAIEQTGEKRQDCISFHTATFTTNLAAALA